MSGRAFVEREAGPAVADPVCIYCGDPATRVGALCDECNSIMELAGEHDRACACGPCRVFAKIAARHGVRVSQ